MSESFDELFFAPPAPGRRAEVVAADLVDSRGDGGICGRCEVVLGLGGRLAVVEGGGRGLSGFDRLDEVAEERNDGLGSLVDDDEDRVGGLEDVDADMKRDGTS